MKFNRRSFLKGSVAVGAFGATGFPHIWMKDSSLAYAAGGEIKVGVLFSLTGTTGIIEESLNKAQALILTLGSSANGNSSNLFSVLAGTLTSHALNLGQFDADLVTNGHTKIPVLDSNTGLKKDFIVQWGSSSDTGTAITVTLPLEYPNTNLSVIAMINSDTTTTDIGIHTKTTTNFGVNKGAFAFNWISFGF